MSEQSDSIPNPTNGIQSSIHNEDNLGNNQESLDNAMQLDADAFSMLETLASSPDRIQILEDILSHHLSEEIDTGTADELYTSLSLYAGNEQAQSLWYLLQACISDDGFIDKCDSRLGKEAMLPVRHLLALYATSLAEVFQLQGQDPEGWRKIGTSTSFNMVSKTWSTRIEIVKCSGESLILTDSPASILALIEALLGGIAQLPKEFMLGEFAKEQVSSFREASENFFNTLLQDNEDAVHQVPTTHDSA